MAIQKVKQLLEKVLDDAENQMEGSGKTKGLGSKYMIQLTFGGDEAIASFQGGVRHAFKEIYTTEGKLGDKWRKINSEDTWKKALRKTLTGLDKLANYTLKPMPKRLVPGPGVYLYNKRLRGGTPNLELIICGDKEGSVDKPAGTASNLLAQSFTRQLWDNWVAMPPVKSMFEGLESGLFPEASIRKRKSGAERTLKNAFADWKEGGSEGGAQLAHKEKTTEGVITMREIEENMPNVNLGYGMTSHNMVKLFRENTDLDYSEINDKKGLGKYEFNSFIHMRMAKNFTGSEITDLSQARKFWFKTIEDLISLEPGLTNAERKLSKSPASKAADDVVAAIVEGMKGKKTVKKVKSNAKAMKNERRAKQPVTKAKQSKKAKRQKSVAKVVGSKMAIKKPKEKQQEKEMGDLLKIEAMINKKLPARVRKNMGRPALRNQTGRFSNSVKLENLRHTKAGISGEYTYQLSPYETFENTGSRKWPNGYNPKPLIAKSIRELALGVTKEKLVSLRRT